MTSLSRLQSLFEQACELPRAEQAAFVDAACADDAELHAELTALLASDEQVKDHTARKAVGDITALLNEGRPDALVGAKVGRYILVSLIGAGGMGSVYLAERHDGVVQQRVAIKFLGRDLLGDGFRQRFEIEREILAKLDHPSITRLIDAEQLPDGTPYYVMDYVEGQPITRYAFENQLDISARLDLFVEVAKAVSHAHQALIVHRDIKPGNILVDTQGAPHLLDFGIAKPLAQLGAQTVSMTVTGQRFFSPQHAAPEQLLGGNITVGCDVYGLGCLLYELLSGEPAIPLTGLTASEAEKQILHQLPQAPSQRVAQSEKNDERACGFGASSVKAWSKSIKGELDSIVLTCLRKSPHERYRSVDDLIADVQAYRAGMPISASGGHGWYRTKKFIARHRWAVTAATLTAIALISSSVITALQSREAKLQRDAAQTALAQAEQQRDRAQHVTQFLIDAFAAANPGGELGKSVTAREILEHGAKKLETELEGQPELKAQLLTTIAEAQRALSLVLEAGETTRKAADLVPLMSDPDLIVNVLVVHSRAMADAGSYDQAEIAVAIAKGVELTTELSRSALARAEIDFLDIRMDQISVLERTSELLATAPIDAVGHTFQNWAWVRLSRIRLLETSGKLGEADHELKILEADFDRQLTVDMLPVIKAARIRATISLKLGDLLSARDAADFAVKTSDQVYGSDSYYAFTSRQTLAHIYAYLWNYDGALEATKEARLIATKILGKNSQAVTLALINEGIYLHHSGRLQEAEERFAEGMLRAESELPADSKPLFSFRMSYARMLADASRCEQALALVARARQEFVGNPDYHVSKQVQYIRLIEEERCAASP